MCIYYKAVFSWWQGQTSMITSGQTAILWNSYLTRLVPCSGCCSVAQSCPTLCDPMDCGTWGFPVLHHLPEFAQTHVHWVGNAILPSHLLLSPSPPAFSLSQHRGLFQWVGSSIRWPKYWSFSFSISLSNQYSELISFRIDCFENFLAFQGNLKRLLQHHNLKASILQCSAIFMVQLSPICVLKKPKALTRRTFVGKVMSLVFSMLSRFIIVFLPRSKHLLISFMAAVIVCSDFGDQ